MNDDMHTRFVTRVELPENPAHVWEVLSEMRGWHRWTDTFDVRGELPRDPWREGARFEVGPSLLGIHLFAEVEVVEADPPRSLTWEGSLLGIPGRHGFVLEPLGGRTCELTHWEECGGTGGRIAVASGAWELLYQRFEQFNADLARYLEPS